MDIYTVLEASADALVIVRDAGPRQLRERGVPAEDVDEAIDVNAAFTLGMYPGDFAAMTASEEWMR